MCGKGRALGGKDSDGLCKRTITLVLSGSGDFLLVCVC